MENIKRSSQSIRNHKGRRNNPLPTDTVGVDVMLQTQRQLLKSSKKSKTKQRCFDEWRTNDVQRL
jgi:hypothetical protein